MAAMALSSRPLAVRSSSAEFLQDSALPASSSPINRIRLPVRRVVVLRKLSLLERVKGGRLSTPVTTCQTTLEARSQADEALLHSHNENASTLTAVEQALQGRGVETKVIDMDSLTKADVHWADLVVSVGGDGTFLTATHHFDESDSTPVVGVNSSPTSSYGHFCAANRNTFAEWLDRIMQGDVGTVSLWRLQVFVNGVAYPIMALNDCLFAADIAACTTKYIISANGATQHQKSSGIWVSTSAGSTAAIHSAGGFPQPLYQRQLQWRVRELFRQSVPGEPLLSGFVSSQECLSLVCRIPNGRIFLDGHRDNIPVNFGDVITFAPSRSPLEWVPPMQPLEWCVRT